jgi:hypothetical protein
LKAVEGTGAAPKPVPSQAPAQEAQRGAQCMVLLRDSDAHRPLINYICFQKLMLVIHMCGLILFFSFIGIGIYRTAEQQQDQPVQLL